MSDDLLIKQTLADGTEVCFVVDASTEPFLALTSQSNLTIVVKLSQRDLSQLVVNSLSLLQTSLRLLKGLEPDASPAQGLPQGDAGANPINIRSRGEYYSQWNARD